MRYRKINVCLEDFPSKLNRVLLVREDIDLFTLGVVILVTMRAHFSHCFLFKTEKQSFIPEAFKCRFDSEREAYMTDYHLLDLGENFELTYDTGE